MPDYTTSKSFLIFNVSTVIKTMCLSFVPSALQPTHKAPWTQLCAAGQTWSWGGRATAGLKTQLVGSPEMEHWAEGHRYTYTKPPAIWNIEMQTEQCQNCEPIWHLWKCFLSILGSFQRNNQILLGSHEASTNHDVVPCCWIVCHRLCTCNVLLDCLLHLIGP